MTHQEIDEITQQLKEEIEARDATIESLQTELHNVTTQFQEYRDHVEHAFDEVAKRAVSGSQMQKTAGRIYPEGIYPEASMGVKGRSSGDLPGSNKDCELNEVKGREQRTA